MKIAIMQPYFFPYIGYWQLINAVDTYVIFDDVNYIKKGYINKNSILTSSKAQSIVLELLKISQNKYINEIEIGNNSQKILKTIQHAYGKAPYFKDVFLLIEDILNYNEKNLAKFLGYSIMKVSSYLELNTSFLYSSDIHKKEDLKGQEKLINISKQLNATQYINAIGGMKLYEKDRFYDDNIKLSFLETNIVEYKQFDNDFIPYLSIIDIMMFNNKDKIKAMLSDYSLI